MHLDIKTRLCNIDELSSSYKKEALTFPCVIAAAGGVVVEPDSL